ARLDTVTVAIPGNEVAEVGLSCGCQAELLLQPAGTIPDMLWDLLACRAPAALLTRIEGATAGPAAMVVDRDGRNWGSLGPRPGDDAPLVREAMAALEAGRSSSRRGRGPGRGGPLRALG